MEARVRLRQQLVVLALSLLLGALTPAALGWAPLWTAGCLVVPVGGLLRAWTVTRALRGLDGLDGDRVLVPVELCAVRTGGLELLHEGARLFVPATEARWALRRGELPPPLASGMQLEVYGWVERRGEGRLKLQRCWLHPEEGLRWQLAMLALRGWSRAAAVQGVVLVVVLVAAAVGTAG